MGEENKKLVGEMRERERELQVLRETLQETARNLEGWSKREKEKIWEEMNNLEARERYFPCSFSFF